MKIRKKKKKTLSFIETENGFQLFHPHLHLLNFYQVGKKCYIHHKTSHFVHTWWKRKWTYKPRTSKQPKEVVIKGEKARPWFLLENIGAFGRREKFFALPSTCAQDHGNFSSLHEKIRFNDILVISSFGILHVLWDYYNMRNTFMCK